MKWRNIEEDIEAFQANHLLCENANSGQITFGFGWMLINFDNELLAMLSSLIEMGWDDCSQTETAQC